MMRASRRAVQTYANIGNTINLSPDAACRYNKNIEWLEETYSNHTFGKVLNDTKYYREQTCNVFTKIIFVCGFDNSKVDFGERYELIDAITSNKEFIFFYHKKHGSRRKAFLQRLKTFRSYV